MPLFKPRYKLSIIYVHLIVEFTDPQKVIYFLSRNFEAYRAHCTGIAEVTGSNSVEA